MASESGAQEANREAGHRNHFELLAEGRSWSGREPNTLFQNRGDGTFDEVGNVLGLYSRLDSRGAATADLDGDGDLDLVVTHRNNPTVKIFRNDTPGQGNSVILSLVDPEGLTPSIGAQVFATCDGQTQLRQVEAGSGFLSQGDARLHFGVAGCRRLSEVTVQWPDRADRPGHRQTWSDLATNHQHTLVAGTQQVESRPFRSRNFNRELLATAGGELSAPRPELSFRELRGPEAATVELASLDDTTAVLNFWATWCTACVAEMPELEALAQSSPTVRFVGISLDSHDGSDAVDDATVLAFAEDHGLSYDQWRGTLDQQAPFTSLAGSPPGVVPLTVVLHRGTIRHLEVGRADVERLATVLDALHKESQ